jgi:hypothetical protein
MRVSGRKPLFQVRTKLLSFPGNWRLQASFLSIPIRLESRIRSRKNSQGPSYCISTRLAAAWHVATMLNCCDLAIDAAVIGVLCHLPLSPPNRIGGGPAIRQHFPSCLQRAALAIGSCLNTQRRHSLGKWRKTGSTVRIHKFWRSTNPTNLAGKAPLPQLSPHPKQRGSGVNGGLGNNERRKG